VRTATRSVAESVTGPVAVAVVGSMASLLVEKPVVTLTTVGVVLDALNGRSVHCTRQQEVHPAGVNRLLLPCPPAGTGSLVAATAARQTAVLAIPR
jgi:hypothetical protein